MKVVHPELTGESGGCRCHLPTSAAPDERVAEIECLRCQRLSRPAIRYERARSGELVHIDSKKLGRIDGARGIVDADVERLSADAARLFWPVRSPVMRWPTPRQIRDTARGEDRGRTRLPRTGAGLVRAPRRHRRARHDRRELKGVGVSKESAA